MSEGQREDQDEEYRGGKILFTEDFSIEHLNILFDFFLSGKMKMNAWCIKVSAFYSAMLSDKIELCTFQKVWHTP